VCVCDVSAALLSLAQQSESWLVALTANEAEDVWVSEHKKGTGQAFVT